MTRHDLDVADDGMIENSVPRQPVSQKASLSEMRAQENERLEEERRLRLRLSWSSAIIGAMVGMFAGYLGLLTTIVDQGTGEFGWSFFRPDTVNFLRTTFAYVVPGALVGGLSVFAIFSNRAEMNSPIRWGVIWLCAALGIPLLSGFLLPITILVFFDFWEGLRPGLWLSALAEEFLGSFLDGYIYMVKVLSAGALSGCIFVALSVASLVLWLNNPVPDSWTRRVTLEAYHLLIALLVSSIPLLLVLFGPFSLIRSIAEFLTGQNL